MVHAAKNIYIIITVAEFKTREDITDTLVTVIDPSILV